ncbi:hypothetical protein BV898_05255 [Hypsibius exemplaris]|uniref:Uncharacterized protein n=1 Tax=Hypsibius exemplaris TaxID=2072580 RepID=A0A1W0WZN7_HYPEX|nr:hypothetical protein BV898_05255 [Hypsibius exemplaris]
MAGMEKQRLHMASAHGHTNGHGPLGHHANQGAPHPHHPHHHPHLHGTAHSAGHTIHTTSTPHDPHHSKIKYKFGINILAFLQFIGGLLMLNYEAISAVLYRSTGSRSGMLYGVEFAGLYTSVFTMVTGIMGLITVRRSYGHRSRMCCFISEILLTIILAIKSFAMACASAAMLFLYTVKWDSVLSLFNRVAQSAQINLYVGTTTTTAIPSTMDPMIAEELAQDFNLLVGLRCILFALYFIMFVSSVLTSCFSCCNYCSCWNRPPLSNVATAAIPEHHNHSPPHHQHNNNAQPVVSEKTEVLMTPYTAVVEVAEVAVTVEPGEDKEKRKGHKHHKHKH